MFGTWMGDHLSKWYVTQGFPAPQAGLGLMLVREEFISQQKVKSVNQRSEVTPWKKNESTSSVLAVS